jgi:hypothetical protein
MAEQALLQTGNAEALTGRLAEYQELLDVLVERPGLTVVSADPWSGASNLVVAAIEELAGARVVVDARSCADTLDLAMAIADSAVSGLAPDASAWWMGTAPPTSAAGLRLSRTARDAGVNLDELRLGSGAGQRRFEESLDLLLALADGEAVLAIDHLGLMLSALPSQEARALLGELRAARQRHSGFELVLVEHPDGPVGRALADGDHPLYRAGHVIRIRRPTPARFVQDLAITRPWTTAPVELVGAAAELASGVPELTWRVVDLAPSDGEDIPTRAVAGWRRLRRISATQTARRWDLLRRVHPVAQSIVAAMSVGLRPHAVAANPKSVSDALSRLRELGMAWQPEERRWALGDPLLAAWVRDHPPPWATRRRQ